MSEFLNYCFDNWYLLLTIALSFVGLILSVIKMIKNGNFAGIVALYNLIPNLISKAEQIYKSGNGAAKLSYVLTELRTYALDNNIKVSTNMLTEAINEQVSATKVVNVNSLTSSNEENAITPSVESIQILADTNNTTSST